MIEVSNLSFEYPGVRALDDVAFTVAAGSITALVGPNGAGKTTLLRCLAGLDTPLAGRITVDGVPVVDEPRACHRRIGYLADNFGLYGELSVRRCLGYVAAANDVPAAGIPAAIERTATALEIESRLDVRAGTLSRGQRQRVAIAQAIIHRPRVLLLDEPASGLDPEARNTLARLFLRLRDEGMTLLVSSHILAELAEYSSDMLVLRAGRIIEHRPVSTASEARHRLELALARPHPALVEWLEIYPGISRIASAPRTASFDFSGDDEARRELLARLVEAGVPVSGLSEARPDLQRSYLAMVGEPARLA
ncbi:MAG: ABC transporter ATP-binding protein [Gammaproteobacteria bacterium]|nr:ABC transporter ATP-binding protein [Gammaproteobacteria bacterium]